MRAHSNSRKYEMSKLEELRNGNRYVGSSHFSPALDRTKAKHLTLQTTKQTK